MLKTISGCKVKLTKIKTGGYRLGQSKIIRGAKWEVREYRRGRPAGKVPSFDTMNEAISFALAKGV